MQSDVSTPENTSRPISNHMNKVSVPVNPSPEAGGTLRTQMSAMRVNPVSDKQHVKGLATSSIKTTPASPTDPTSGRSDKRSPLRQHINPEQQSTMRAALDSVSQTQLRRKSQHPTSDNLGTSLDHSGGHNSSDIKGITPLMVPLSPAKNDTFVRVPSPTRSIASSNSSNAPTPTKTGTLRFQSDTSAIRKEFTWDAANTQSLTSLEASTLSTDDRRAPTTTTREVTTITVAAPNAQSLTGELTRTRTAYPEPFLAIKKFDQHSPETATDDSSNTNDFPPLLPHQIVLTSQEGHLHFDLHEIQFKMAIYGTDGRSTGCRMEVRFGNVGEL